MPVKTMCYFMRSSLNQFPAEGVVRNFSLLGSLLSRVTRGVASGGMYGGVKPLTLGGLVGQF